MIRLLLLNIAAILLLSGCATRAEGEFPSLAKRPQESAAQGPETQTSAAIAAPADAALLAQLRDITGQISNGEAAFRATLPKAQSAMAAARGAAPASEAWVQAAMLLAALEFDRGTAQAAMAELDRLLVERATADQKSGQSSGLAEIGAVWSRANAQVNEQTRLIEALKAQLTAA
jgi:hypothetical protein